MSPFRFWILRGLLLGVASTQVLWGAFLCPAEALLNASPPPAIVSSSTIGAFFDSLPDLPKGFGVPCSDRSTWDAIANRSDVARKKMSVLSQADQYVIANNNGAFPAWNDNDYLTFSRNGSRTEGEKMMSDRRAWVSPLTLAYCLTNDQKYLGPARVALNELLEQRTWVLPANDRYLENFNRTNPTVDLVAAETAHEIAQAVYLLRDNLDSNFRDNALVVISTKIFQPVLNSIRSSINAGPHWWLNSRTNWNAVCLRGVTGAALAILPNKRERALFAAIGYQFGQNYLRGYDADGYSSEGLGYWGYGFSNFAELRELLVQASNYQKDLFQVDRAKVENIGKFPLNFEMDDDVFASFGDSIVTTWDRPTVAYLSASLGLPQIMNPSLIRAFPNVTWDAFSLSTSPLTSSNGYSRPLFHYFADAGVLVSRADPAHTPKMALTIKGSERGIGHWHHDIGSYAIALGTSPIIGEPGGPRTYSGDTFGSNRFNFIILNSSGHPVPVVNGQLQNGTTPLLGNTPRPSDNGESLEMTVDMKPAYSETRLTKLARRFLHHRPSGEVVVEDQFSASEPISFQDAIVLKGTWTYDLSGTNPNTYNREDINSLYTKLTLRIGTQTVFVNITADTPIRVSTDIITESSVTITRFAIDFRESRKEGLVRTAFQSTAAIPVLTNPGFEEAADAERPTVPAAWSLSGNPNGQRVGNFPNGGAVLAIESNRSTTSYQTVQQLWAGPRPGATYQLSFWGKVVGSTAGLRGFVDVRSADIWRSMAWVSVAEPEWTKYSITFSTTALEPGFWVRGGRQLSDRGGSVQFDDFSITQVSRSTGAPNPPTDLSISTTPVGVNLRWQAASGGALRDGFRVDVSTTSDFTVRLPDWNARTVGDRTDVNIGGLEVGKTYYARVRAYNALTGNSLFANVVNITLVDTTPPAITGMAPSEINTTSATIRWTTSEPADSQVEYGTTADYGLSTELMAATTTTHARGLSDLGSSTTYYFRVKSKDPAGNLSTATGTFVTAAIPFLTNPGFEEAVDASQPLVPTGWTSTGFPRAERTTAAGAYRTGSAGLMIGNNGSTPRYQIAQQPWAAYQPGETYQLSFWGRVSSATADVRGMVDVRSSDSWRSMAWVPIAEPEWTQYSITFSTNAVEPWLLVRCYRTANNSPGWVYFDDFTMIRVPNSTEKPSPPTAATMANMTANSFVLSWSAPTGGALRDGFKVDVSTMVGFNVCLTGWKDRVVGMRTSVTVRGLEVGKTYYARVLAYNALTGASTYSTTSAILVDQSLRAASTTLVPDSETRVVSEGRAYPIPCRPGRGASGITFDRLPAESRITIGTIRGRPVRTLYAGWTGVAFWDLFDDAGQSVPSGIYVVVFESEGKQKTLKVMVVR